MLCDSLEEWDGRVGGRLKREGIYVYLQLTDTVAQQKLNTTLESNYLPV